MKYKQGDLNKNGSLDAEDAAIMLKYISGSIQLDETQLEIADANSDGSKDMLDVISILNMTEIS
ncbi:MAG: dockerin type I repeat-containing protein [Firmicutes bacterium]|nr:dockerin type I repeat-containing protein [Bacillota bacterium]